MSDASNATHYMHTLLLCDMCSFWIYMNSRRPYPSCKLCNMLHSKQPHLHHVDCRFCQREVASEQLLRLRLGHYLRLAALITPSRWSLQQWKAVAPV
jgi:hypothetical protein